MSAQSVVDPEARRPVVGEHAVLPSRIEPPAHLSGGLSREDLVGELVELEGFVVIDAPGGYGKTTLTQLWAEMDTRPVSWITLTDSDADPAVLLRHLVAALSPHVELSDAQPLVTEPGRWNLERVLDIVCSRLRALKRPLILVVDDIHVMSDGAPADAITRVADGLLEGGAIALVGRGTPHGLHLARRALSSPVHRYGIEKLRLGRDESVGLLQMARPGLADAAIEELASACGGWAAGVSLVGIALAQGADPEALVTGYGGVAGDLGDYFHEEVMTGLSAADREFLMATAVLEDLTGELCDELLDTTGSGLVLERLVASGNLLMHAFGSDTRWYRYHQLFREFLLTRLAIHHPGAQADLRIRAARWLAQHGLIDAAVGQAQASGDLRLTAELIYGNLLRLTDLGRRVSVERWLGNMAPSAIHAEPALELAAGWCAAVGGDAAEAQRWLGRLADAQEDARLPDGTSVAVGAHALGVLTGIGGVAQIIRSASMVAELGPDGSIWWPMARLVGSVSAYQAGQAADPVDELTQVVFDTRGWPTLHSLALAHLGLLELRGPQPANGHAHVLEALEVAQTAGIEEQPMVTFVCAVAALDDAARGDRDRANARSLNAVRLLDAWGSGIPRGRLQTLLVLAEAARRSSEDQQVRAFVDQARPLLRIEPDAAVLHDWSAQLEGWLRERARNSHAVVIELTPAEERVLEQLATHRSQQGIADQLYLSRNTIKSHTLSIYRKLGVSNRSDAVEEAARLGLLSDLSIDVR